MVVGGWILMSVILTNCYNGLMISSLNSPLPKANIPETFQDLICHDKSILKLYKLGANLTDWVLKTINEVPITEFKPFYSSTCFKLLSAPGGGLDFEFVESSHITIMKIMNRQRDILMASMLPALPAEQLMDDITMDDIIILLLGKGYNSLVPEIYDYLSKTAISFESMPRFRTSITDEVARCRKSVLVFDAFEVGFKFDDMTKQYYWTKFYKSKDILNFGLGGWTFLGEGQSKVPQYFQSLFESGIQMDESDIKFLGESSLAGSNLKKWRSSSPLKRHSLIAYFLQDFRNFRFHNRIQISSHARQPTTVTKFWT
ncbi:hypothetical protein Fcan01_15919 [Folsomia candida]|uniref:Uncharacterized protein n=1 Tax=Folsomia candida TaxID=158441 RepID=A0A226DWV0_FOLCA|nr:hypothetical protein Fcan01_15919 [Folsomia candida]